MAIGVTFSVKSNLGVSPVNAIPYVVSVILGIDQGLCVSIIFCSYIILQFFILRKEFNLTGKKSPTSIGGAMNCPIVF
uniref:hypothetical protein n=1 Tax=Fusobacterium mortiferum TaxID=850 RepID=UPI001EF6BD8D